MSPAFSLSDQCRSEVYTELLCVTFMFYRLLLFFTVHLLVYKYLCRIQSKFTRRSDSVLFINMLSFFCLFRLVNSFYPGMEFCVRFVHNRLSMRLQHRALSLIEPDESDLENVLFPTEDTARTHGQLIPADTKFQ